MNTGDDQEQPAPDERDLAMLELERSWWKHLGRRQETIRERFDMSPTIYYQRLNWLLDQPAAFEHDPMLIKRLRRLRSARRVARTAG